MDLREFLTTVVTAPLPSNGHASDAWFCLALGPKQGSGWYEDWYRWPNDLEKILDKALTAAEDCNVYFSSYLFKEPTSTKVNVLPSRTIQADLDDADTLTLPLQPSILVQTSEGRHQGYWFLKQALDPEAHEVLSRKLTYAIPECDTSGWPLGRKVRVPYTFNFKYLEGAQQVLIRNTTLKSYDEADLEFLVEPPAFLATSEDVTFLDSVADLGGLAPTATAALKGPQELLNSVKLPTAVKTAYNVRQQDRSKALWALLCAAFRAGLSREEVWWLGYHSANNKFGDLKYHGERELAKDVLRAEASVKSKIPDERAMVADVRRLPGPSYERRSQLLDVIVGFMRSSGEFIHTSDDLGWYIRGDQGRPITISPHSEWLDMLLDVQFGLNGVEQDKAYVSVGLNNFCRSLPINGIQQALSYYDPSTSTLLLHTGRKDVIRVTPTALDKATDGSYGVVFPWGISNEPFNPSLTLPSSSNNGSSMGKGPLTNWGDILFKSALNNVIGIAPDEAQALLQVWLLFLLFRSAAVSRPILAFFGQPGAGKSTLFRRIYTLLYGRRRSVTGVTTADNFDQSVASDPFVVLDNVDRPETWLPDRLALSASTSDVTRRKLYTDADDYILRRQALVGITAHNPHFNREDVADRLLLLTFSRLQEFLPEGDLINSIVEQRNRLWGGIILDCQRVLRTPLPMFSEVPQFRVEDFARTGYWIATALGLQAQFSSALETIGHGQRTLNLEEDHILVVSLQQLLKSQHSKGKDGQFLSAATLWDNLIVGSPDANAFRRVYRNAVYLGKKLWALQDSLKEVFDIKWKYNTDKGAREWCIGPHPNPSPNGLVRLTSSEANSEKVPPNTILH